MTERHNNALQLTRGRFRGVRPSPDASLLSAPRS